MPSTSPRSSTDRGVTVATSGKPSRRRYGSPRAVGRDPRDGPAQYVAGARRGASVASAAAGSRPRGGSRSAPSRRLGAAAATSSSAPATSTTSRPRHARATRPADDASRRRRSAPPPPRPAPGRRAPSRRAARSVRRSAPRRGRPRAWASPRSWVTSTVVTRSWRRMAPRSARSAVARSASSSPANGSSSSSTSGSSTSARASATRCASPPESVRACRARERAHAEPLEPRAPRAARRAGGDAAKAQAEPDVVGDGHVGQQRLLEHRRHPAPLGQRVARVDGRPWKRTVPASGRSSSPSTRSSVDLPLPFGPDDRQQLARPPRRAPARRARSPPTMTRRTSRRTSTALTSAARGSSRGGSRTPSAGRARSRGSRRRAAAPRPRGRSRPAPAGPARRAGSASVQVVPKSASATTTPVIRFMWWVAIGGPRSLRISRTYSGRMKNAIGAVGRRQVRVRRRVDRLQDLAAPARSGCDRAWP